jgi:hypothetical protein
MLTVAEMFEEAQRLSTLIDAGIDALRRHGVDLANAEHAYRKAKGQSWVRVLAELPGGTVPAREAWVNEQTATERLARDIADAERSAALEAVRSRRAQLSAVQTMANAHREEAGLARTGVAA